MRLTQIRIKNYRSITSEVRISFGKQTTIVGPNNSGKTNLITAIQAFFSGILHNSYRIDEDLPRGLPSVQTSIIANFDIDPDKDNKFYELYLTMLKCIEGEKKSEGNVPLFLYFSSTGKPVYKFFSNDKIKPKQNQTFRSAHDTALRIIMDGFSCKYIPSVKDPDYIYKNFLLPCIKRSVADVLRPYMNEVNAKLSTISEALNECLKVGGLKGIKAAFDVPSQQFENSLSTFDFQIDDGLKMSAKSKGSGVQAATLLSALRWVGEEERKLGRETIWLLEEPESYLHPQLANSCSAIVKHLGESNPVIVTTHSVSFVNQNPLHIYETQLVGGMTQVQQFSTYSSATASIRSALGLRFSDFYHLNEYNVFVEGETDRELITWALGVIKPNRGKNTLKLLRQATIVDFTGVSSLKDFLKHSYDFIRKERAVYVVFDGDKAGAEASSALNGYFGKKKIPFIPNEDYSVLPSGLPIEGLFPQNWISDLNKKHPNWFETFNVDLEGKIIACSIKDSNKGQLQRELMRIAEEETSNTGNYVWGKHFVLLFNKIEESFQKKGMQLYGD